MTIAFPALFPELIGTSVLDIHAHDSLSESVPTLSYALLAQVSGYNELKQKLETVLNMIMLFGFLYGTIRIIGGAAQIRRGEIEEGKAAIISGALIAAAPLIMRILFEIFFNSGGSVFGP